MHVDATVARQFAHRKGVGRMKYLDIRYMWLQSGMEKGTYMSKKVPRLENPSDMLTHSPNAEELARFLPMVGVFPLECSRDAVDMVKATVATKPQLGPKLAATILSMMAQVSNSTKMAQVDEYEDYYREAYEDYANEAMQDHGFDLVLPLIATIFAAVIGFMLWKHSSSSVPTLAISGVQTECTTKANDIVYSTVSGKCWHADSACCSLTQAGQVHILKKCTHCAARGR